MRADRSEAQYGVNFDLKSRSGGPLRGLLVSLVATTLVLAVSVDAFGQKDDKIVQWVRELSELERVEMEIASDAAWRAKIDALIAVSTPNLPARSWYDDGRNRHA